MITQQRTIDLRNYVQGIRISGPLVGPLATWLVNAAPPDVDAREREALDDVVRVAGEVSRVMSDRERLAALIRPVFDAFGNHWRAVHERLLASERVSSELGEAGERIGALLLSYFPDGAGFTRLEAPMAWSEGQRRLKRMTDEGTRAELEALVGASILATAERSTHKLGKALGLGGDPIEIPSSTALQETLGAFSQAVGRYGRILLASVREQDAVSIARFSRAVAPIDRARSTRAGRETDASLPDVDGTNTSSITELPPPPLPTDPAAPA